MDSISFVIESYDYMQMDNTQLWRRESIHSVRAILISFDFSHLWRSANQIREFHSYELHTFIQQTTSNLNLTNLRNIMDHTIPMLNQGFLFHLSSRIQIAVAIHHHEFFKTAHLDHSLWLSIQSRNLPAKSKCNYSESYHRSLAHSPFLPFDSIEFDASSTSQSVSLPSSFPPRTPLHTYTTEQSSTTPHPLPELLLFPPSDTAAHWHSLWTSASCQRGSQCGTSRPPTRRSYRRWSSSASSRTPPAEWVFYSWALVWSTTSPHCAFDEQASASRFAPSPDCRPMSASLVLRCPVLACNCGRSATVYHPNQGYLLLRLG